jgi:hypothetical protein
MEAYRFSLLYFTSDSAGDFTLVAGLTRGFHLHLKITVGRKKTIVIRMLD